MGAQVSAGNVDVDESRTIKENVQNIILKNIQKSQYNNTTGANINQNVTINCGDAVNDYLKGWKSNWGPYPQPEEISKLCSAEDIQMYATLSLNVKSNDEQNFANDTARNITADIKTIAEKILEQPTLGVEIGNEKRNASELIQLMKFNAENENLTETIKTVLTSAKIDQKFEIIGVGNVRKLKFTSNLTMMVDSLTDQIFKNIDKAVIEGKITDIKSEKSENTFVKTVGSVFNNVVDGVTGLVDTAAKSGMIMYIITLAIAGFLIYIFGPCNIPYISKFCSKDTIKNTQETINKRSSNKRKQKSDDDDDE